MTFPEQEQRAAVEYEGSREGNAYLGFIAGSTWRGLHGPERKETECLRKALEVAMRVLTEFNRKFSPGDDWFPEMRDVLAEINRILGEQNE